MDLGIFGKLIENVAPTIATALGGPVAGMAVKALSTALLVIVTGLKTTLEMRWLLLPQTK
jgi:hypothetical protein